MKRTNLAIVMAAGTCLTAGSAMAQQMINISGATLLENFVASLGSTNDYIDVDGNGVCGRCIPFGVQNLLPRGTNGSNVWNLSYRVVGSVNGFRELTLFGGTVCVSTDDTVGAPAGILGSDTSRSLFGSAGTAYFNGVQYITGGNPVSGGAYQPLNAGGIPQRAATSGANRAISGTTGCVTIDIAPLDVSTVWATNKPGGAALAIRKPQELGYGRNPRLSVGKNGEAAVNAANPHLSGGLSSQLSDLNGRNLFNPATPLVQDGNTIFDTELFYAPIAPVANFGTGLTQIKITELQHLFTTGRANNGENLVVCTRDVGSGTRNAFMNSICIDPSWGVGDSIGGESSVAAQHNAGAQFYPTNKTSNGGMEAVIRNTRLGIGYVGTERGVSGSGSGSWITNGVLEILNTQNDTYGGTQFVRPTIDNLLDNSNNGWLIGGQAVLATIGDPAAEPVASGGLNNGNTPMVNKAAAAYVNNVRESIAAFVAVPGGSDSAFMPGERAAGQFILLGAIDNLHDLSQPCLMIANPGFNQNLQNYTRANNIHNTNSTIFSTFGTRVAPVNPANSRAGKVPTRATGVVYSDGVANGNGYLTQGGAVLSFGANLPLRNYLAGDFNADGIRSTADATGLVNAWRQRNGGPVWTSPAASGALATLATTTGQAAAPGDAVIELLGDFDANGSFDTLDVRYWADGLALVSGNLDRKAGFTAVDTAFGGNFFGTVLGNGACIKPYAAGDARGDVFGTTGRIARGWAPVGADGKVDARDIDYVFAQFKQAGISGGSADWSDLSEAVLFDLSADMNGDRSVNNADINEIVTVILGTCVGDVNLDGVKNVVDTAIVQANLGTNGGWALGDLNGDGTINAADLALACPADFDCNGSIEVADIFTFLNGWFAGSCKTDFDGINGIEVADIFGFLNAWFAGGC